MEFRKTRYVKMIYTMDYDTPTGKSRRPLRRAYQKAGIYELIEDDCPFVLGYINEDGKMVDFITHREILTNGQSYQEISREEIGRIYDSLGYDKIKQLYNIMCVMFFDEEHDLGFEISTMEELDADRKYQWKAYNDGKTTISPYDREVINNYSASYVKKYNRR